MKTTHLLVTLSGVLAFGAMATAAPITTLSQGFEDAPFTDGATVSTSAIGNSSSTVGAWWTSNPDGYSSATLPVVTTEQYHTGSQSLKITRSSYQTNDDPPLTQEVNIEMYGRNSSASVPTSGHVISSFYVYMTDKVSMQFVAGNSLGSSNPGVQINPGGGVYVYTYDTAKHTPWLANAVPLNEWVGFKIDTNIDAKTFDVYIDRGSGFAKANADPLSSNALNVSDLAQYVTFKPKGTFGTSFYIDDVKVETVVPEPATAALLLLGGAGLLLKRRLRRS